mmetsp:Transcript_28086/g.69153  ORF Transcript_28086/g.69153 Transcript_28086/m.69153 type:complete len:210 (+) Transcript_28086:490-1119(+)
MTPNANPALARCTCNRRADGNSIRSEAAARKAAATVSSPTLDGGKSPWPAHAKSVRGSASAASATEQAALPAPPPRPPQPLLPPAAAAARAGAATASVRGPPRIIAGSATCHPKVPRAAASAAPSDAANNADASNITWLSPNFIADAPLADKPPPSPPIQPVPGSAPPSSPLPFEFTPLTPPPPPPSQLCISISPLPPLRPPSKSSTSS